MNKKNDAAQTKRRDYYLRNIKSKGLINKN